MENIIEFKDLIDLYEYVNRKIELSGLTSEEFRFYADVVRAKSHKTGLYISVSQPYSTKYGSRNIEITVYVPAKLGSIILTRLGLKSADELVGKKWIFQGRLSFYKDRLSFTFYADTIAPVGDSEIEKRRKEILNELKAQNLLMTEIHDLSELEPIKKIAIISSKTAAGYEDFLKNLTVPLIYRPIVHLYESPMQGAETATGIILALNRIRNSQIDYDVVVIARGGGASSDLMYFDDLKLGIEIANFNNFCPVLSGIGHERDFTIPDYVAWKRFATPTEVARAISKQIEDNIKKLDNNWREFEIIMINFLDKFERKTDDSIIQIINNSINSNLKTLSKDSIEHLKNIKRFINFTFSSLEQTISSEFISYLSNSIENELINNIKFLENFKIIISQNIQSEISQRDEKLNEIFDSLLKHREYAAILFGGAILRKNKNFVNSVNQVKIGDNLRAFLKDGTLNLKVVKEKNTEKKKEEIDAYGGHTLFKF
ncbi:MAG: exodeoxyribonuclease large subunit [Thermosipho sp. (in: thermotogales)]|nr:exodeoxyribonuclease large subunit [Thermosipho sp. (in: thermotogales)]MDN5325150.1 exodeoxyribonuclease large subunit [Thermosipho sp. (in: thermotogales)]